MNWNPWRKDEPVPTMPEGATISGMLTTPAMHERWARVERLVEEFRQLTTEAEQQAFLEQHPEVYDEVSCHDCGGLEPEFKL